MSDYRIAIRYARAFYRNAVEKNMLSTAEEDAKSIVNLCDTSRPFDVMLRSPVVGYDTKEVIVKKIFTDKLNPITYDFIHLVLNKRRGIVLESAFREFLKLVNQTKGIIEAHITTAMELSPAKMEALKLYIANRTQKEVIVTSEVNPKLLGGYIIRYGDTLIDASVSTQLKEIQKTLIQAN